MRGDGAGGGDEPAEAELGRADDAGDERAALGLACEAGFGRLGFFCAMAKRDLGRTKPAPQPVQLTRLSASFEET
ncbi:MAG: hypothetical protein B6D36_03580 [Planctomycetes bacterium UTPLA1]|jgi:hypothetical protein|nr:MAG: hypothetical protein B6D36_03580 [Planctomycetes bacterium UTPLA1]